MDVVFRIVKYIKNNPGQGILLSNSSANKVTAYCDANWAACPVWKLHRITVCRNSAKTKYRNLTSTIIELVWLLGMLKDLDINVTLSVNIYSDSKAAIQLDVNHVYHERIKHIEIGCHIIREKLQQVMISINHISAKQQLVDLLTKGLSKIQHELLLSKLGIVNIFTSPSLRESIET